MSYFVHAFQKKFLGTKGNQTESKAGTTWAKGDSAAVVNGVINSSGIDIWELSNGPQTKKLFGTGNKGEVVGIFDYKTNKSLVAGELEGQKFYIASSSLISTDKIGKFHGGYAIANKSKYINPRYINNAWKVIANDAISPKKGIGVKYNADGELEVCERQFYCGETYYLRVDVKGTPAMRFARHNLYRTFQADGGCCANAGSVNEVSSVVIYKQWAEAINNDPMLQDFIKAYIVCDNETYSASAADAALIGGDETKLIESISYTAESTAYIVLLGAYEDTTFGNCSFAPTDYYGLEPIRIYASEVDLNGDPCSFESLCVEDICLGVQANGLGEQKLREILLHEKYLQNSVASDPRIREITGGDDILNSVDRSAKYDSFYLLHSVPRKSNADSLLDNDQYLLEIILPHVLDASGVNAGIQLLEQIITPCIAAYTDVELVEVDEDEFSVVDYTATENSACTYVFPVGGDDDTEEEDDDTEEKADEDVTD